MRCATVTLVLALAALVLVGCASEPEAKPAAKQSAAPAPQGAATPLTKHPLAKYLEVAGFRVSEQGQGKLKITFTVVNHSEADIGDLGLKVKLSTTTAKPGDPPIAEFEAKTPRLGRLEVKELTAVVPTKLRVYELPDWQFLHAEYEITSPAPPPSTVK